uniref:Carbohydrate sulfotransferase n=1 Tax=Caenorhabditis japonica TaxID=281687 RepID=A0A8R1DXJ9_CAEJA
MWSLQRLIIYTVIILILLKLFYFSSSGGTRDLKRPQVFNAVARANPLWVKYDPDKKIKIYKQIPAFAQASNKIATIKKAKTAVCEIDASIGQSVLCNLQQSMNEEGPCDSDSIQHYKHFDELGKKEKQDKNLTDWKILFPRRDPIDRIVEHFIDTCVREAGACFDCEMDFMCYLGNINGLIKDLHKTINLVREDDMKYIPQNWFCQMETMAQRITFVDYNVFANPTNPENANAKRPDKISLEDDFEDPLTPRDEIREYLKIFIHTRADALDLVKKIYYWDFVLLKLPLPELKVVDSKDYKEVWDEKS